MTTKEQIEKRLEALEQKFEKTLKELEEAKRLLKERDLAISGYSTRVEELVRYEKLAEAIRELVPSAPATATTVPGDTQTVNLAVPQYDVNVEVDPVKFDFKKDDLKSQVLYGIFLTKSRKRLSDIKETMIDRGYKKAVDEITGLMTELEQAGLVLEFDQDKSHKGYKLTPKVIWHFPEEKEE